MMVAILACSAPSADPTAAPPATVPVVTAIPEATVVAPNPEPTVEVPAESSFLSGTGVDIATLPTLFIPPAGIAGFCGDDPAAPTIAIVNLSNVFSQLCLYQWPAADAPGFHVDLVDPNGVTQTSQFTFAPLQGGITVLDSSGGSAGNILTPNDQTGQLQTVISLNLYLEANVVPGAWTITATADDGSFTIGPSSIDIFHGGPTLSAIYNHEATVFQPQPGTYNPGDTLSMVGSSYPANTQLTLVLFRMDQSTPSQFGTPSLFPEYAVEVTTDASGSFSVDFLVGTNMPKGGYQMVADPALTSDTLVNPFIGQFTIQ
jgi:hypothetical protein